MEIVKLPLRAKRISPPIQPSRYSRTMARKLRHQRAAAFSVFGVSLALLALSLAHQAKGIQLVTDSELWEAYAMAIGIDFGFVTLELANLLAAYEATRRRILKYTNPAITGTLAASGVMNAFAFAGRVPHWDLGLAAMNYAPAILLGVAIPAMIYCLTRVGAAMYLASANK